MSKKVTTQEFIDRATKIHNDKWSYKKTVYVNMRTPVTITCPKCGDWKVSPADHIWKKCGCPKCRYERFGRSKSWTTEQFIQRSIDVHGNVYDYSKVKYTNMHTPVTIICKNHGEFIQRPAEHTGSGKSKLPSGCPKCRQSVGERTIEYILQQKNIEYYTEHAIEGPIRMFCDFWLPTHNLIIEYDGPQHYKNVLNWDDINIVRERDRVKNQYAYQHNIRMLRIPYWEYNNIQYIIEKVLF